MEHQKQNTEFKVGSNVFEKFEILELIGSGGAGAVYKARDVFRQVNVALKVLLLDSKAEKQLMRFQREAQLASKLKHRNIATILDFGVHGGTAFLTLELVEGESLEEIIDGEKTLSLPFFLDVFIQICEAVEHAHKNGVLHRDLKPANVVISEKADGEYVAKILDFGIAKSLEDNDDDGKLTATGNIIGSPLYMSPEQANAFPLTAKSDLYSLGSMMFRCLTGRPPIEEATAVETIMSVSKLNPPKLSEMKDLHLPEELCKLVDGLLSKSPEKRPSLESTILPVLKALQNDISVSPDNDETSTGTESTIYDTNKKNKKIPILAYAVGAILVSGVAFVLVSLNTQPNSDTGGDAVSVSPDIPDSSQTLTNYVRESEAENGISYLDPETRSRVKLQNDCTDQSLDSVARPLEVTTIHAEDSQISNLQNIKNFVNLQTLDLAKSQINDASLANLIPLKKLRKLNLRTNAITDDGLLTVRQLIHLKDLDLSKTKITANGLKNLESLKHLSDLTLQRSKFSAKTVELFAGSIPPKCQIDLSGSPNIASSDLDLLRSKFPDLRFDKRKSILETRIEDCKTLMQTVKSKWTARESTRLKNELLNEYVSVLKLAQSKYGAQNPRLAYYYELVGNIEGSLRLPDFMARMEQYYKTAVDLHKKSGTNNIEYEYEQLSDLSTSAYRAQALIAAKSAALRMLELSDRQPNLSTRDTNRQLIAVGEAAHAAKDYQTELKLYDHVLETEKKSPRDKRDFRTEASVECSRANALMFLGKRKEAIQAYDRSLELSEKLPPKTVRQRAAKLMALTNRASIYLADHDPEKAVAFSDLAYKLSKESGTDPLSTRNVINERVALFRLLHRDRTERDQLEHEAQKYDRLRMHAKPDGDSLLEAQ